MVQIKTPQFPESVYEASVGAWFKSAGDSVSAGDALLELHTDKAVQEVNALEDGVITAILKQVDDVVQPGDALCEITPASASATASAEGASGDVAGAGDRSDVMDDGPAGTAPTAAASDAQAAPRPASSRPDVIEIDVAQPIPIGGAPASAASRPEVVETAMDATSGAGASDVASVAGSDATQQSSAPATEPTSAAAAPAPTVAGDEGASAWPQPSTATPAASSEPQPTGRDSDSMASAPVSETTAQDDPRVKRVRLTRRQLTAARMMLEVTQQTVMTTTFNEVDMSQIIEIRKRRGPGFLDSHGVKLGFMSFFVKAVCSSLKAYPVLNSEIAGTDLLLREHYDIGIAVASDRGLVVPVIRDADEMTFAEIEHTIAGFGAKARSGAWSIEDLTGGTFTITNGGVFGSMLSTPILNPPQVGILGMHNIVERPVAVDGKLAVRPIMYLALTYDHRIVEGAQAVQFLRHAKTHLESAEALLIGT